MSFHATIALMTASAVAAGLSIWSLRRGRKAGALPWVPWHGVLFAALFVLLGAAAHLPKVWPR